MKSNSFNMVILSLLIILSLVNSQQQPSVQISQPTSTNNSNFWVSSLKDKIDAINCLKNSAVEIKQLIELIHKIQDGEIIASIIDTKDLILRIKKIISNCKVLFCWGPTFIKCEEKTHTECEKYGEIVYPKCKPGYTNWDCCVCASICPEGFRDDGLYCAKPASYGRGAGYTKKHLSKCEEQNPQGCEKNGALYYPKCRQNFHNVACCVCSPNCPSGWTDIGVSCKKPDSYGRGVGFAVSFGKQCLNQKPKIRDTMKQLIKGNQEDKICNLYAQQLVSDFDTISNQLQDLDEQTSDLELVLEYIEQFEYTYDSYIEQASYC